MCGRFNVIDNPDLNALLDFLGLNISLPTAINIAPTETVAVVFAENQGNQILPMRWWLTPHWAKEMTSKYAMFNARSEGLSRSPAFRGPFKYRRAIIPASSFIEWQKQKEGKQPLLIEPMTGAFAFAALWDRWQQGEYDIYSCTIITTAAVPGFESIHQRMPVILQPDEFAGWLDQQTPTDQLQRLLAPRLNAPLRITPLDRGINHGANKSPKVLRKIGEAMLIGVDDK